MFQIGVIVAALWLGRTEDKLHRIKTRIAILYAVAVVWLVISTNTRLPKVVSLSNALRDANMSVRKYRTLVSSTHGMDLMG